MADLTDQQITEACAMAAKVWETAHEQFPTMTLDATFSGIRVVGGEVWLVPNNPFRQDPQLYDPLHDDAQAMALVKKFGLTVSKDPDENYHAMGMICEWPTSSTDLNRAICLCVALMQIEKEKNANG